MSAADDSLVDALGFVDSGRTALQRGDMPASILFLCSAERFWGLASGMASAYRVFADQSTANIDEVAEKIGVLRGELMKAATPKRADPRDVQADIIEGLEVFRSLDGVPLTDDQIKNRARNLTAGLVGNYIVLAP